MLNEPTIDKLYELRLATMAETWRGQQGTPKLSELSFDERFAMLVDAEHAARRDRKVARLLKQAGLRLPEACMEDVTAGASRGLDKAVLRQLRAGDFLEEGLNVLLCGPTGVGKTYLACALGQAACRRGRKVLFRRLPRLFEELALAKADGTYTKTLAKIARAELLILDDLGMARPTEAQRHDLLEVLDDRDGQGSTVITAQLPVSKWHEWLADPTVADAILDRLVHRAYKITLKGPSKRKERPKKN